MIIDWCDCDQIIGDDDDQRLVWDDSDLVTISDKLKIVSINEEIASDSGKEKEELLKSDEELARMLQVLCFERPKKKKKLYCCVCLESLDVKMRSELLSKEALDSCFF